MTDELKARLEALDADWWRPDPEDPFWMLEAEDGEWLKNRYSLLGTRDATKAIRFPTEETAMAHPARMNPGRKWWSAKATEHKWIDSAPAELVPASALAEARAECERLRVALDNIRALSTKAQAVGGPNGTLAHIEGFARAALGDRT